MKTDPVDALEWYYKWNFSDGSRKVFQRQFDHGTIDHSTHYTKLKCAVGKSKMALDTIKAWGSHVLISF